MKRNTGCGCGGSLHKTCPPLPPSDTAKTHDHFSTVGTLENINDFERTVILADVPITANVEADICLPSSAYDIKHIRKNVYLTQCKAVPVRNPGIPEGRADALNLYIEGYIHKNIQYSEGSDSYMKDYSVNVPFKAYHPVTGLPRFNYFTSQKSNQVSEVRELSPDGMGSDRCSFGSETFENFNQAIQCKILRARVTQVDIPYDFDRWGNFSKITEKATVNLVVRLTQVQRRDAAGDNPGEAFFTDL